MKVLKFGGTSVGTPKSLTSVKNIVEAIQEDTVVVVSALGGITDKLIATGKLACEGGGRFIKDFEDIRKRHYEMINDIVPAHKRPDVVEKINPLMDELRDLYKGINLVGELSERSLDLIVSFGERISSIIVANVITGARHFDSPDFIKTEKWFGKNIADSSLTEQLIKETFKNHTGIAVCGGFISKDRDSGEITNLGRGGSDYTAALIAAALDASVLEIWTDVDGFMTGDPRIIKDAFVVDRMSFIESMQLCSFGAKVIYPPTIYPVFHKNIPIRILNTFNPEAPGTLITDEPSDQSAAKGVSSLKGVTLLSVRGLSAGNVAEINTRIYNCLAKRGIRVILVGESGTDHKVDFGIATGECPETINLLQEEFAPELAEGLVECIDYMDGLSIVAIVGENIRKDIGFADRIFNTLERARIQVYARAAAGSETTISFAINEDSVGEALNLIHDSFFKIR